MAEFTSIGWCDATVNFWHGCTKVSEGCKFCYMFRDKEKFGQKGNIIQKSTPTTVKKVIKELHVRRIAQELKGDRTRLKIFTCSWSDFFLEDADPWRAESWDYIRANPEFDWLILTKRPERITACLPDDWGNGWDNVLLGISAENQARYDERIYKLVNVPAKRRFISAEPLLDAIDLHLQDRSGRVEETDGCYTPLSDHLHWVIVGGESGNDSGKWLYRPCKVDWINLIVDQCVLGDIRIFVKQLGTFLCKKWNVKSRHGDRMNDWPEQFDGIKYQEFYK